MLTLIFLLSDSVFFCLLQFFWFDSFWLLPVNFLLSLILALLITFLILIASLALMSLMPPNCRFKGFIVRSFSNLVKYFLRIKIVVKNSHFLPLDTNIVIYANHKSHTDPFVLASAIPRTIAFAPKDQFRSFLGSQLFLKLAFSSSDCMVICRNNIRKTASNLMEAVPKVRAGLAMVIFPEGGIKDRNDEKASPLLGGSFKIAVKSKADIVPISLKGTTQIKHSGWWSKKTVQLIIHPPLKYDDYCVYNMNEIAICVQHSINSCL